MDLSETKGKSMTCDIYTDGSCTPNPGSGGWAYVIPSKGIEKSGGEKETTNNRMEMRAIVEALRGSEGEPKVRILSDSQLCINTLTGLWKCKKNRDLWFEARALMEGRHVVFQWVRGHNGNQHNERCDFLAGKAAWQ
jgi:ribonuclease HI